MRHRTLACLTTALLLAGGAVEAFENSDFDPKTAACSNFYQYANGGWLKTTPVPANRESHSAMDALIARNEQRLEALTQRILRQPQGPVDGLIADFVASGLDEAAIEKAGLGPLAPLFAEVDAIKRPRDLTNLIARWHARGLPVLLRFDAGDDLRQPGTTIAYASQGGLNLPDRDFYLRQDEATRNLLGQYRGYAQILLGLAGSPDPQRDAGWALDIEMRLAAKSLDLLQLRDPANSYRPTEVSTLTRRYPAFRWKDYLKAQGLSKLKSMSFAHTTFFDELESLLKNQPLERWKPYLKLQLLDAFAPYLPQGYVAAHDDFHGRLLAGQIRPPDRLTRVLAAADLALGDAIGQRYVETYLDEATLQGATAVVDDVRAALRARLAQAPWLQEAGRAAALAKLDALDVLIARPARWRNYGALTFDRGNYTANVLAAALFRNRMRMGAIGAKRPDDLFPVPTQIVNAFYAPHRNQLVVSAALLQAPVFDAEADAARNYGALGAVVGHELTHGFDLSGQLYDAEGRLHDGWTQAERDAFQARTAPLQAQFDGYTAVGEIKVDGRLTQAENIADLSGLELAWAAFAERVGDTRLPQQQGYSPAQRFFLGWGQLWRRNDLETALIRRVAIDPHAPPSARVNGSVSNMAAFGEAFACKPGQPMFRGGDQRLSFWGH